MWYILAVIILLCIVYYVLTQDKELDYDYIDNIELDGVDTSDYPDFCDAYISYAEYKGKPMTDEQLDELNEDGDFIYEQVQNYLY